jgi:hypothetical protein
VSGTMRMIESTDPDAWSRALERVGGGHPFYHPDLLGFLGASESARAELLVFEDRGRMVVMPWLLRELPDGATRATGGRYVRDAFGPDYAGPLASPETPAETLDAFWDALDRHARETGTLSLFLRLNPFDPGQERVGEAHGARLDREVIWVDLSKGFDGAWAGFASSARKNYKRSVSVGLTTTVSEDDEHVEAFAGIYAATMERRQAQARYRFDLPWFRGLLGAAAGRYLIVTVWKQGAAVASHLYLHASGYAFSYLGGAIEEHWRDRPSNAVVTAAIRTLPQRGATRLILGGGYQPGDGIENFKRSFSPLAVPFRTLRRTFDREAYEAACPPGRAAVFEGFFPAYRAPAPSAS